ncbi:Putative DNA-binding protein. Homolog to unamed gene of MMP and 130005 of BW-1 [Desulfamplus magnetovallimortis]|uniref:Putative DNA-binding protein. Homolog to unamed gene of MMP and 130005 of BW-1 n=1 Tax=Desulfamplus magnetovallimortis TaxID=1246637 RepID=L0R3Y4_9BACT|nr:hypothetical protein [Desulfamplus magnetovallimortis]CCO06718.1 Putative DNA-binding protein. Homolog to unamed gene of MMP and 130005 of BW-1 [Desulfamplus magnetovallimortis BW-1]SLM32769.1 Putative DNA-binding protein. Homolog to unamed gene of MMP and 130005 of BW-1 [Desulfamplus magnetovallimortis]
MGEKTKNFEKGINYSRSVIDYLGLVSWSIIRRCSNAVQSTGQSMMKNAAAPFSSTKKKVKKRKKITSSRTGSSGKTLPEKRTSGRKISSADSSPHKPFIREETITKLEASIARLESRLATLEKQRAKISDDTAKQNKPEAAEVKKEINQEKRAVLRMLVEENKLLKELTTQKK